MAGVVSEDKPPDYAPRAPFTPNLGRVDIGTLDTTTWLCGE
jgi:hypothetical protein